jgi:branched-chain amino acid transport system ATP-binding protein
MQYVDQVLELREITAGYGDTTVLREVSLTVPDAGVVALLGPNGAGKSTLLRTASGLIRPRSGTVVLDGEDVTGLDAVQLAQRGLCLVPEGRSIFPSLSVKDNLILYCPKRKEKAGLERAIEAFPVLGPRLRQIAGTLSGGEQQMLAMVRAYVADPRLVLVDEASLGLAPMVVDRIFKFMAEFSNAGTALLMVEQYVNRAIEMSEHVYLLSHGEIAFSGLSEELRDQDIFEQYLDIDVGSGRAAASTGSLPDGDSPK